ncbi:MAG: tyrosine-type recombinase/integrase [Pyrinomonadaceae bacterium]
MASGYILKRSETCWIARVEHNSNGRRRYFSKSFSTEDGAKTHLQNQQSAKNKGEFVEPSKVTMAVLMDEWLESVRLRVAERTADGYQGLLDRYVRPVLGSKRVNQLETRDIQKLYANMQNHQSLSARVVRHTHATLRQVLEQGVEWKLIARNPADSLRRKLPKAVEVERRVLDEEEAGKFLIACQVKPRGLIFEFALLSGMRPEEFLALQWRDLNLERGTASVRRVLVRHKGAWRFHEPKTKGSRRPVSIPTSLMRKLATHKRIQSEQRLKVGSEWQSHDLVFCSEIGTPLSVPNLTYRYYRPILTAAGIPRIRLYDLRHSCATLLLAADEHIKIVSERLGHSTTRLTLDTYSHVLASMQQKTSDKLEAMLYSKKTGT